MIATNHVGILAELQARRIQLAVVDDRLRWTPKAAVTADEIVLLRRFKSDLIRELTRFPMSPPVASTSEAIDPLPEWPAYVWDAIATAFPVDADGRTIQTQSSNRLTRYDRPWMPWTDDDAALIDWFQTNQEQLPAEPFDLKPGVRVIEPSKFLRALSADIQAGSNAPRAVGLLDDLQWLFKVFSTWQD